MRYSDNNIEDWDFRHCAHDDPDYDVEAHLFFGTHFTTAVAVDAMRVMVITTLIDKGIATVEEDRQHVRLIPEGDAILLGWKSGASRWTQEGRFERKVVEALRRENQKYGRLRVTILPPLPGLRANQEDDAENETIREESSAPSVHGEASNGTAAAIGDPSRDRGEEQPTEPPRQPRDTPRAVTVLNGELFDQDPEHEAYWAAVTDVLHDGDRGAIPDIARQMSLNHLQHMLTLQGIGSFEAWVRDLAESFADAYLLAGAEDWDFDPDAAKELIDDCMLAVNRGRLAVGSDAITSVEPSTWLSLILLGLRSDLDEWEPLNSYVRLQDAWQRLDWVFPTYLAVGEHIAQLRSEERESWRSANQLAWQDGIALFLLHQLGLLSAESGERTFGDDDRPLSGALFELDPQQYRLRAAQLMQATAQAVPDVAREIYAGLIGPFVEQRLARDYGQWLRDTFECGYVLSVSETWEGLDEDNLRQLIDEGLRRVIAEKDSRDPDLLINDPEYRIRNVSYGIMGDMPYFAPLTDYLGKQDAFTRIGGLGDVMLTNVLNAGGIKRRHVSKLQSPLYMSFMLGVSVGLLDQLGEVPPTMPERLP